MNNPTDRDDLLYEIATAYYVKKQLQRQIAERYGISRVQISKYLKMAEALGIVKIEVIPPRVPKKKEDELGALLRERFSIKTILLAARSVQKTERLYHYLAKRLFEYLSELPDQEMNIGVGWGQTIYEFSEYELGEFPHKPRWKIVPLSGGLPSISDKYLNINRIVSRIADKLGGQHKLLYLPFLMEDSYPRKAIESDRFYKEINEIWNNLNIVICSVGHSIARSPFFRQPTISADFLNKLQKVDVVGDFATHYYDINGKVFDLDFSNMLVNISTEQFRSAKQRIIVAGGVHKAESLIGMLRTGLVDILVSDENTVANVLECIRLGPGAKVSAVV